MKRHVVIHEEMLDYDLRGSELLAYALIWGFCQDGQSDFHGSAEYVARWCKVSRQQAVAILKSLTDKGYLIKTEYIIISPESGTITYLQTPGTAVRKNQKVVRIDGF